MVLEASISHLPALKMNECFHPERYTAHDLHLMNNVYRNSNGVGASDGPTKVGRVLINHAMFEQCYKTTH